MKKILSFSILVFALAFSACAQNRINGNGIKKEETRKIGYFNKIDVSRSVDVIVTNEKIDGIRVVAEENIIGLVETETSGGVLKVKMAKGSYVFTNNNNPKIYVPNNGNILAIKASGSSDVYTENTSLNGKNIELKFSGSSDFNGEINADECLLNYSGSSDCKISGKAKRCTASFSGSSDLKAQNFVVENYELKASGSSDAKVNCTGTLNVTASGSSDVKYSGNCTVQKSASGGSSVEKD